MWSKSERQKSNLTEAALIVAGNKISGNNDPDVIADLMFSFICEKKTH